MKIEEMITADRADCSGCAACANVCPKSAIEMIFDAEGFAYPKINPELCIQCGKCDATCPALNFTAKKIDALPLSFVANYKNEKILRHSSSGGIFSALSEIILNDGGIVFGAGFDKNWRVVHTSAKNFDELENLRGSKYVQSQIGDVYRQVKDALKSKKVLFSGVPCQCAGLKRFLGADPENLLTVEIICHGAPSPALWKSYIDELNYSHEIAHVNFRSKRKGWGAGSHMAINCFDRGTKTVKVGDDLYGRLFLRRVSLRPSCSTCKFKFPNGQSDLTLGDAWGIKDFAPEMFDNLGVSVVFVHTAKGKDFFDRANLNSKQVNFFDAFRKNARLISPAIADQRREKFFADLKGSTDWFAVMQKYYAQDDTEFRKVTGKKSGAVFQKNLKSILSQVRENFAQNILIISSLRKNDEQKELMNFFEQGIKNVGLYFLQPKDEGHFTCTEKFSGVVSDLKDAAELTDFVKQFNIASVYVEKPLNFGENFSAIAEWLKTCGLPAKLFAQKKK